MNDYPEQEHDGPLGEVLSGIPDEAPPPDLEARCLKAVHTAREEAARAPRPTWFRVAQGMAAAAAIFLFVVSVATVKLPSIGFAKKATLGDRSVTSAEVRAQMSDAPTMSQPPAGAAPSDAVKDWATLSARAEVRELPASPEPSAGDGRLVVRDRLHVGRDSTYNRVGATNSQWESHNGTDNSVTFAKPWRDQSGEKQKIVSKTMDVEVPDVEDAYREAVSVIEKAEGTVLTEDLRMDERGRNTAHIYAKIPVDRFDGVVAQIKDLGKIVELVGESEDRTKEYNTRGSDIRGLGAQEVELVAKYEKETNRARKQQLYYQIQALRADNKDRKSGLSQLSEQTHYATLDLTLQQAKGPTQFLSQVLQNSKMAGAWIVATAVLWVPLLATAWFATAWSRRRRAG